MCSLKENVYTNEVAKFPHCVNVSKVENIPPTLKIKNECEVIEEEIEDIT